MADVELKSKILRQVEYYFGNINLSKDNFIKKTLEQNEGWFPIEVLLKFNRLQQLTTDIDTIKEALKNSNLLEISERGIRRDPENPAPKSLEEALAQEGDRVLYAKGFPKDLTLDKAISWLTSVCGEVKDVYLKRYQNKQFKGSIYVTFESDGDAKKFLTSSECAAYEGNPLFRQLYSTYIQEKTKAIEARMAEKEKKKEDRRNSILSRMTKGAVFELDGIPIEKPDSDDEKPKAAEAAENGQESAEPVKENKPGADEIVLRRTATKIKNWINEQLKETVHIAWVDVNPAERKALVRCKQANAAKAIIDKLTENGKDGKITCDGNCLTARLIEGEEEIEVWTKVIDAMDSKKRKGSSMNGGRYGNKRRRRE